MKIPQQDEIVDIEYKGERLETIVKSVIEHEGEKGAFWIWLEVSHEIPTGETVCWLLEEGRFPSAVHELLKQNGRILIRLGAYQGVKPQTKT